MMTREESLRFDQRYENDDFLYHLIEAKHWDRILELLAFQTRHHERTTLKVLLSHRPDSPLWTILHENNALSNGAKDVCLRLIDIGGEEIVNREAWGWSPLQCACHSRDKQELDPVHVQNAIDVVEKLIQLDDEGCLRPKDCKAWIMMLGEGEKDVRIVEKFLEIGGEKLLFQTFHDRGFTALHAACSGSGKEQLKYIDLLLDRGGERLACMTDLDGKTPLHVACSTGCSAQVVNVLDSLLQSGGERLAVMVDRKFRSALDRAFGNCWIKEELDAILDLFIKVGVKSDLFLKPNFTGNNVLHKFVSRSENDFDCSNSNVYYTARDILMSSEEESEWLQIIQKLLHVGGRELLLARDTMVRTPLHRLCYYGAYGSRKILNEMIKTGGSEILMAKDWQGFTPLHYLCNCCMQHTSEMVRDVVLACGIEVVFLKDMEGRTPLHVACCPARIRRGPIPNEDDSPFRVEVVHQLLNVGRDKLLFQRCQVLSSAVKLELWRWHPNEQIVHRFMEIEGQGLRSFLD